MNPKNQRHVLLAVKQLKFGPESDIFSSALKIVLSYLGEKDLEYRDILCTSGRAFKISWNERMWNWKKYLNKPDPDPEYYLRDDYETMHFACEAMGYEHEIIGNKDCIRQGKSDSFTPLKGDDFDRFVDNNTMRGCVLESIRKYEHPVIAALSVTEWWAPEWCIITGYDESGDVITGWSCFQDEKDSKLQFEPNGYFRLNDWERNTLVAVRLGDKKKQSLPEEELNHRALEYAVKFSQGSSREHESLGFNAYAAWKQAIEDDAIIDISDDILKGMLTYHRHFIGHLAAQKWYSSDYLHRMKRKGWNVSDVLHASANYAKIHELMWDCWKIAGGYWRKIDDEIAKFKKKENRQKIASIINEAKKKDMKAVDYLDSALENWNKTHSNYLKS